MKKGIKMKEMSISCVRFILITFLLVAPVIVNASTYFSYPYDYTINDDNTVTLLRYNGPGGDVVIPDHYCPVKNPGKHC